MSKENPVEVEVVNQPQHKQRTYAVGEKVWYEREGKRLPCVIVNSHQTGGGAGADITYSVQGDISGADFPAGVASGPFNEITEDELEDR